jgi:hypothetical protein
MGILDMDANTIKDILLMLPDGVLFGSLFVGLVTLSQQHIIFFVTLLEGLFFLKGFQSIASFMNGTTQANPDTCKSKFQGMTFANVRDQFNSDSISYGVYILTLASSYFINSNTVLNDELEVLDSSYITRSNVTMYLLVGLTLSYALFKVLIECDSFSSISLAIVLGGLMGLFLVYQNVKLFDRNTVNFMGIPLLRNRTADNKPIYICSQ